jgi:hypothetical protein
VKTRVASVVAAMIAGSQKSPAAGLVAESGMMTRAVAPLATVVAAIVRDATSDLAAIVHVATTDPAAERAVAFATTRGRSVGVATSSECPAPPMRDVSGRSAASD